MTRCAAALTIGLLLGAASPTQAQDMLQYLDLKSDEFTKADLTPG